MVGICALDNVHTNYFGEKILHDGAISRLRIELWFHDAYMTNFPKKLDTLVDYDKERIANSTKQIKTVELELRHDIDFENDWFMVGSCT